MESPLPPDPYAALGLPTDATAAAIKSSYRKLALKYHPDKVVGDDAAKAAAQDEFHKIQQAYEILNDQDKRERYD
ncbi:heat shock protein DnaJ, partial [Trichodelitschia bisporula]